MSRHRPFLPLLALAVALLALGACGRRGSLEPPGASAAAAPVASATPRDATARAAETAQATGPDAAVEDEDAVVAVPSPAPGARRRKGYAVPPGPFILDPIL